jgi:threonine dehydrogenase-like Zn-dependent dehydrogenase
VVVAAELVQRAAVVPAARHAVLADVAVALAAALVGRAAVGPAARHAALPDVALAAALVAVGRAAVVPAARHAALADVVVVVGAALVGLAAVVPAARHAALADVVVAAALVGRAAVAPAEWQAVVLPGSSPLRRPERMSEATRVNLAVVRYRHRGKWCADPRLMAKSEPVRPAVAAFRTLEPMLSLSPPAGQPLRRRRPAPRRAVQCVPATHHPPPLGVGPPRSACPDSQS